MTLIFEVMNVRLSDCKIGEELKVNKIEDGDIAPKLIEMGLTENLITKIIFTKILKVYLTLFIDVKKKFF